MATFADEGGRHVVRSLDRRFFAGHSPTEVLPAEVQGPRRSGTEKGSGLVVGKGGLLCLEDARSPERTERRLQLQPSGGGLNPAVVAQTERPTGLVAGDKYDASVAAEIITNKYGYHLPVYRQQDLFAGSGWTPSRSTLLNVLEASAFVLAPLVFFDFTVTRQRAGPELALKEFSGKLMADCHAGYQGIELRSAGRIERGACVAHARRKVFEARDNYPREANLVLAKFRQLYDIISSENSGELMRVAPRTSGVDRFTESGKSFSLSSSMMAAKTRAVLSGGPAK